MPYLVRFFVFRVILLFSKEGRFVKKNAASGS
jgi:hypothetical protein